MDGKVIRYAGPSVIDVREDIGRIASNEKVKGMTISMCGKGNKLSEVKSIEDSMQ